MSKMAVCFLRHHWSSCTNRSNGIQSSILSSVQSSQCAILIYKNGDAEKLSPQAAGAWKFRCCRSWTISSLFSLISAPKWENWNVFHREFRSPQIAATRYALCMGKCSDAVHRNKSGDDVSDGGITNSIRIDWNICIVLVAVRNANATRVINTCVCNTNLWTFSRQQNVSVRFNFRINIGTAGSGRCAWNCIRLSNDDDTWCGVCFECLHVCSVLG